jgi:hypothetical protein
MSDVKLVELSGTRKEISEKIKYRNTPNKNIRDSDRMNLRRVTNLELGKNENGNQFADSHNILNRWLLNVYKINDVRHEIHTNTPLVYGSGIQPFSPPYP